MDSRGRVAADIALASVVAAFLVAGAAFTAGAVLGPRPPLVVAVSAASRGGGASLSDTPSAGRSGSVATDPSTSSPAPSPASQPGRSASAARVATRPPKGGGQVQAGGDIHVGDGAGGHDGN